jgi:ubiquinone/menaquinone biosynthesis C-methylase UbiE
VHTEPNFAADLYHGTAESYDRFRLAYPQVLTEDLISRVQPSRHGRLLDLACGTGQLAFALSGLPEVLRFTRYGWRGLRRDGLAAVDDW